MQCGVHAGNAWYTLSAMRVVNQALGRVIRHRHDYGAILLADERFARSDMRANISFWARQLLNVRADFGDLAAHLHAFFRDNAAAAPRRPPRAGVPTVAMLGKVRVLPMLLARSAAACAVHTTHACSLWLTPLHAGQAGLAALACLGGRRAGQAARI
jgi:Helicase C-terminal domain